MEDLEVRRVAWVTQVGPMSSQVLSKAEAEGDLQTKEESTEARGYGAGFADGGRSRRPRNAAAEAGEAGHTFLTGASGGSMALPTS